jgi:hypothetical protein
MTSALKSITNMKNDSFLENSFIENKNHMLLSIDKIIGFPQCRQKLWMNLFYHDFIKKSHDNPQHFYNYKVIFHKKIQENSPLENGDDVISLVEITFQKFWNQILEIMIAEVENLRKRSEDDRFIQEEYKNYKKILGLAESEKMQPLRQDKLWKQRFLLFIHLCPKDVLSTQPMSVLHTYVYYRWFLQDHKNELTQKMYRPQKLVGSFKETFQLLNIYLPEHLEELFLLTNKEKQENIGSLLSLDSKNVSEHKMIFSQWLFYSTCMDQHLSNISLKLLKRQKKMNVQKIISYIFHRIFENRKESASISQNNWIIELEREFLAGWKLGVIGKGIWDKILLQSYHSLFEFQHMEEKN